jgi:uncharacterized protein (DUF305 family)
VRDVTRRLITVRVVAAVAALCAGFGIGVLVAPVPSPATGEAPAASDTHNDVDVGFATDMAFHHAQALAMCQRVLGTDTGGSVQAAAAEILPAQSYEMGLLQAWLREWGESTAPPEEAMGWMHAAVPATQMPGYATDEEMLELARLTGSAKGRRFLELMRGHHVGGIHMAEHAARHAGAEAVRAAAERMVEVQTYEIAVFDELLAADDT